MQIIGFICAIIALLQATRVTKATKAMDEGVWLSGAAYCGKENYNTMQVSGPASGFKVSTILYDPKTDLQGFAGVLETSKSIYVVFRGSSSLLNWMDDAEIIKDPYISYPDCGCQVHHGFYKSALNVKNATIESVFSLQKKYKDYDVIVTGHSYGAAVAQLMAMELEKAGIETMVYNYGQPRTGDKKYADFVNTVIKDYARVTHHKDIVPHVPPTEGFAYYHSCGEVYEDAVGALKRCSEIECEDPTCADQYKLAETNGDDHSIYLGHVVGCEEST